MKICIFLVNVQARDRLKQCPLKAVRGRGGGGEGEGIWYNKMTFCGVYYVHVLDARLLEDLQLCASETKLSTACFLSLSTPTSRRATVAALVARWTDPIAGGGGGGGNLFHSELADTHCVSRVASSAVFDSRRY